MDSNFKTTILLEYVMALVKVLIEGYAKEIDGGWLATSTTTLITEKGQKIIVDPGTNRPLLLQKLKEEELTPEDINCVFMTHYHPDHNLLTGIFHNAIIMDDSMFYRDDKQWDHQGVIPGTNVKILKTPGHDQFHGSLVVSTKDGVVVVAGDVFWWADNEEEKTDKDSLLSHPDPFEKDHGQLITSRKQILDIADWIIPGHGRIFKVVK